MRSATPGTVRRHVWGFTSQEYAAIDDFEAYNDEDNRIYNSWIDGVTNKASGSQVGCIRVAVRRAGR